MSNTIQITAAQLIIAIAGAAAIGALVSSLITLFGQWRERKSRREELLLTEAIRITEKHMDASIEFAKARLQQGQDTLVDPIIETVATTHRLLKSIFETGALPQDYVTYQDRLKRGH